jgi:PAS domain S-box-containing protein
VLPSVTTPAVARRAAELYEAHHEEVLRRTDRWFAYLMLFQFLGGLICALVVSPRTWAGAHYTVHIHVWAALGVGGLIAVVPVTLAFARPGRFSTRFIIATGQMLTSALLIHLTGGRIETHFHVFGSLAFLAFYRDWRVFIPATLVVFLDHLIRGIYWPESVYGVLSASPWRSVEHAAWVLFEDAFLIRACVQGVREMKVIAEKRAQLEQTNALIEEEVRQQTSELQSQTRALRQEVAERQRAEQTLREMNLALANAMPGIARLDVQGRYVEVNDVYAGMIGYEPETLIGMSWEPTVHPHDHALAHQCYLRMKATGIGEFEARAVRKDGSTFYKHVMMVRICDPEGAFIGHHCFMRDITQRKQAEAEREALHRQLMEVSRQAGMSEVATGVLHNVGNVLNSVNVSAAILVDKVRKSDVSSVAQIAEMMQQHADNLGTFLTADERGRLIPKYLAELGRLLVADQSALMAELESLGKNIEHIREIINTQQSYAKISGVLEPVRPADLIEDALRINDAALRRHGVRIVRDYEDASPVTVDKQKVLQVLVNLISNAKYAMATSDRGEKTLTLRLRALPSERGRVRIEVIDNGVGIPSENLTRIFSHGFTTRKDGHGFGLHSASLAAQELGGSLTAHSQGPGRGARFILDLPSRVHSPTTKDQSGGERHPVLAVSVLEAG